VIFLALGESQTRPFRIWGRSPSRRLQIFALLPPTSCDGWRAQIDVRAFDVLMARLEAHGSIVSKQVLIGSVSPGRIIEGTNLQKRISALRAALGADRNPIRTAAGRGYQLTGEVKVCVSEFSTKAALGIILSGRGCLLPSTFSGRKGGPSCPEPIHSGSASRLMFEGERTTDLLRRRRYFRIRFQKGLPDLRAQ
jgi:Transcriptional regulatory protein, C terminal